MAAEPSDASEPGPSKEDELLARHRKEVKDLRAKIQALKKTIPKGDRKKKKEVGVEIARLEQELEDRHKGELEGQKKKKGESDDVLGDADKSLQHRVEGLGLTSEGSAVDELTPQLVSGVGKKTRAQKRKEKKAQREQERDRRIAEGEVEAAADNPRLKEREKLTSVLSPLGLAIKDITPDGHCLYAAIADQLAARLGTESSVSELRSQCADYICSHSDEFLPYLVDPDTGDQFTQGQLDQYCTDIAETATWGGQLEEQLRNQDLYNHLLLTQTHPLIRIRALSHVHKVPVKVFQAEAKVLTIGEEYPDDDGKALTLAYHLHEYGLGEHYNSVVPR